MHQLNESKKQLFKWNNQNSKTKLYHVPSMLPLKKKKNTLKTKSRLFPDCG